MTTKFNKMEKFEGKDFRCWQKNMHFMLSTLKDAYVLSIPRTEVVDNETLEEIRKRSNSGNDDYIHIGHILNGISDYLFDTLSDATSVKELWDT